MDCGLIMKLQPAKRMSQGLERATRVSLDHSYSKFIILAMSVNSVAKHKNGQALFFLILNT